MAITHAATQPASGPVAALKQLIALLNRWPEALIALPVRVAVAIVFWRSGLTKIANWDTTVQLFADEYRVPVLPPELAAYLATIAELACPVLLVLGLAARFGAAALFGMTLVIQLFVYPESWPDHVLWFALLLYVITRGAGALSLDRLIAQRFS
jgi:putative oxidoreductase